MSSIKLRIYNFKSPEHFVVFDIWNTFFYISGIINTKLLCFFNVHAHQVPYFWKLNEAFLDSIELQLLCCFKHSCFKRFHKL